MKKHLFIMLCLIIFALLCNGMAFSSSFTISESKKISDYGSFKNGKLIIDGDFTIDSGALLIVDSSAIIEVRRNIVINGKIKTTAPNLELKIRSTEGNIKINGGIEVEGQQGQTGNDGGVTEPGEDGYTGLSSELSIIADRGEINIQGSIINQGGIGGLGGEGGRSEGKGLWGEDGGNGGSGGKGGTGGTVYILAKQNGVLINGSISSIGGTGGKGGTGGPDKTVRGGPGDGGTGGIGGDGGKITILGQKVVLGSNASLDLSPGSGGKGGNGGDGATWSDGDSGDKGADGTVYGDIQVAGGEVFTGESLDYASLKEIRSLDLVNITTDESKIVFEYDRKDPEAPTEVILEVYQDSAGKYYAKEEGTVSLKFKLPKDVGVEIDDSYSAKLVSGLAKFEVQTRLRTRDREDLIHYFSKFGDFNFLGNGLSYKVEVLVEEVSIEDGWCILSFPFPQLPEEEIYDYIEDPSDRLSFNLDVVDHNDNRVRYSEPLVIYVDSENPTTPHDLSYSYVGDTSLEFSWISEDEPSGVKEYDLTISGEEIKGIEQSSYTYDAGYNDAVTFEVIARDNVGNESNTASVELITPPRATRITSIQNRLVEFSRFFSGYYTVINFDNVGSGASSYKIKYYQINSLGQQEGSVFYLDVASYLSVVMKENILEAHTNYKFFIQTYNRKQDDPDVSGWIEYPYIVRANNNVPTIAELVSPSDQAIVNLANKENFALQARRSSDLDDDILTYQLYIDDKLYEHDDVSAIVSYSYVKFVPILPDGTYTWFIRATDGYDATVDEPKRTFTIDVTRPGTPSFTVADVDTNSTTVQLQNIAPAERDTDVEKLRIWVGQGTPSDIDLATITNQTHSITIPNIEGTHTIYMKAVDDVGNESEFPYQLNVTYDTTAPTVPSNTVITSEDESLEVDWADSTDPGTDVSGVAKYKMRYRKTGTMTWSELETENSESEKTIPNLLDHTEYQVQIKAIDHAGNESGWTTSISQYTKPSLGSLTFVKSDYLQTNSGIVHYVEFTVNPGQSAKYQILRQKMVDGQPSGEEEELGWQNSSQLSYIDDEQVVVYPNGVYEYRIKTANLTESGFCISDPITVIVDNNLPVAPTNTVSGFVAHSRPQLEATTVHDPDGHSLTYYYYIYQRDETGATSPIVTWQPANQPGGFYTPEVDLVDGYTYFYKVGVVESHQDSYVVGTEPGVVSSETSFTVDQTPPQITLTVPEAIQTSVANGDPVTSAVVTVSAIDQNPVREDGLASGLSNNELTIYIDDIANGTQVKTSGSTVTMDQGLHTLYVRAQDNAGNETQTPVEITIEVDSSAPEVLDVNLTKVSYGGTNYTTNGNVLYVDFELQDLDTGVESAKYAIISDQENSSINYLADDRWSSLTIENSLQDHYTITAPYSMVDGTGYYFVLYAINEAGGEITYQSERVVVDTEGPEITFTDTQGTMPTLYQIRSLADLSLDVDVTDSVSQIAIEEYALIEAPQESLIVNGVSDLTQLSEVSLSDGSIYYLAVRGTDHVGHTTVRYSVPILYDTTGPVVEVVRVGDLNPIRDAIDPQWYINRLNVYWKISDEVNMSQIRYAIGTQDGGKDISSELPGNVDGWLVANSNRKEENYSIDGLNLNDGFYYITLEVTNDVGLVTTATTSVPVQVDSNLPITPLVSDDGLFTQSEEIHFTVTYPTEELREESYDYQIIDSDENVLYSGQLVNPNQLVNVSETVTVLDGLSLDKGVTYYVLLGHLVNGQFAAIAYSDGIELDTTAPMFTKFEDGSYYQSSEVNISWEAQDEQSGIAQYYVNVGTTRGGSELTNDWVPVEVNTSTTLSDLNLQEGIVYYVSVKAVNGAGQETIREGDGFEIDDTNPQGPLVLSGSTYATDLTTLSASWFSPDPTQAPDAGSGVVAYYYDILETRDAKLAQWKPVESVTGDPLARNIILTNLNLINGSRYYIAIKAEDRVGLAAVGFTDGIIADVEAPDIPTIDDLREYQTFTTELTAEFESQDDESGLAGFIYSVRTLDGTTVINWTNIDQRTTTESGLALTEGEIYFFAAKAIDNAGYISAENSSNGITVDSHDPVITSIRSEGDYVTNADQIFFQWESSFEYSPIVGYEYAIARTETPADLTWYSTTQQQIALIPEGVGLTAFEAGVTYYFFVRAKDILGKYSEVMHTDVIIDATPPVTPVIISNGEYQSSHLVLAWESSDGESGIASYEYGIGTQRGATDVTNGWIPVATGDDSVQIERNDLELIHNQRYYLVVKAQNNAGQWSEQGMDDGFLVDLRDPVVTGVVGPDTYHNDLNVIEDIEFTAVDEEVGLKGYRYQVVLASEKDEVTSLTTDPIALDKVNGSYPKSVTERFDARGLSLMEDESYYIALQTQNILNMWSTVTFTEHSFVVDVTPPTISFEQQGEEIVTNIEDDPIDVQWNTDEPGTAYYRWQMPNGTYIPADQFASKSITSATGFQTISFDQSVAGTYELELYMVDEAGNQSPEHITQQIRVNAPPTIQTLNPMSGYKGRDLTPTSMNLDVQDSDGTIVNYQWDFGDQTEPEDSVELAYGHVYAEVGSYTLTLTVTDNDGATATAQLPVTVTNTLEGQLQLNETWSGTMELKGDVTVPAGVLLTISAGTRVIVPLGKGIYVNGTINVTGTSTQADGSSGQVYFTTFEPSDQYGANLWKGIYLADTSSNSLFSSTTIQYAERGLILHGQVGLQISYSTFEENGIGIHMEDSTPQVEDSIFEYNLYYGIKEEDGCDPEIKNNTFIGNGLAPYYDYEKTLLTLEEVNTLLGYGNE